MQKLIAYLVGLGLVMALLLGVLLAAVAVGTSPEVINARAQTELARAKQEQAKAMAEQAKAQQELYRAEGLRLAIPSIEAGYRVAYFGGGLALMVFTVGGAWAVVVWLNMRAMVVYPNGAGHYPLLVSRSWDGSTRIVDTSRGFGAVTVISADNVVSLPVGGSEQAQLQISTQAQAAAALVGIASRSNTAPAEVVKRTAAAASGLPAPQFNATASGDNLRLVYVKKPGAANTEAARDLQDLKEFIEGLPMRGAARRGWMGYTFRSGHECTRARYDDLMTKLKAAGVLVEDGTSYRLGVEVSEALDAFGVGERDEVQSDGGDNE